MSRPTKREVPSAELDEGTFPARRSARTFADVDETSAQSFPASDPPSWTSLRVGAPKEPVVRADEKHAR